jgi:hypothetical protein
VYRQTANRIIYGVIDLMDGLRKGWWLDMVKIVDIGAWSLESNLES